MKARETAKIVQQNKEGEIQSLRSRGAPLYVYRLADKMSLSRPLANTLPTPRPAHAKRHCPDPPKVSPPRTKHSNFPLKSGRSAAGSQLRVTSLTSLPYPCDSHSMARPSLIQSLVVCLVMTIRSVATLQSDRGSAAVVQPRAHKNFRLRRAGKQPLSDVSRAGKQVWTGQKKCPPKLILCVSL